ncbi:UbiA family prenyltransferase [bacterium]|nr:UbiA family prenyltransferase [bacterium]
MNIKRIRKYQRAIVTFKISWELLRPFTLIAPATGIMFGGLTALGAVPAFDHHAGSISGIIYNLLVGAFAASLLNAGSNVLNQLCDLAEDRINKPNRPLVSNRFSVKFAKRISAFCYLCSLFLSFTINSLCFFIYLIAAILTILYSTDPVRLKKRGILANFTIALTRGLLLWLAAWASIKPISNLEPWFIGGIWFLFFIGASVTKDFADIEGDRVAGINTLPVRFGERTTAVLISPFLVLPFLLIPIGAHNKYLSARTELLDLFSILLVVWGSIIAWLMIKHPTSLGGKNENHLGWKLMYGQMIFCQIGLAVIYLTSRLIQGAM